MEALEFLKEAQRFCKQYKYCSTGCPLYEKCVFEFALDSSYEKEICEEIENTVATIEQWSKEHPLVTNAQKFKEVFGYSGDIVAKVKPERLPPHSGSCGYDKCTESCGSRCFPRCPMWWNDEFKEPEHENE